jgi:hypothetical protein
MLIVLGCKSSAHREASDSQSSVAKNPLLDSVLGVWWDNDPESPSAAFKIEANGELFNPEKLKSYKYSLSRDTLSISYEEYTSVSVVRMRSRDSMLLINFESGDSNEYHRKER